MSSPLVMLTASAGSPHEIVLPALLLYRGRVYSLDATARHSLVLRAATDAECRFTADPALS